MSLVLPSALAVGFFLLGLGLGVLCVLKKQVSGRPQWSPIGSPSSESRTGGGGGAAAPTHPLQGLGEVWGRILWDMEGEGQGWRWPGPEVWPAERMPMLTCTWRACVWLSV